MQRKFGIAGMSGSRDTLMITAVIAVLLWPLSSANVRYTTQITYLNHSVSRAYTEMRKISSGVISDMKSFDELCSYCTSRANRTGRELATGEYERIKSDKQCAASPASRIAMPRRRRMLC